MTSIPCVVCSEPIPIERVYAARSRGLEPKYCSPKCKATASKRRSRARKARE